VQPPAHPTAHLTLIVSFHDIQKNRSFDRSVSVIVKRAQWRDRSPLSSVRAAQRIGPCFSPLANYFRVVAQKCMSSPKRANELPPANPFGRAGPILRSLTRRRWDENVPPGDCRQLSLRLPSTPPRTHRVPHRSTTKERKRRSDEQQAQLSTNSSSFATESLRTS